MPNTTFEQRVRIQTLLTEGYSIRQIAEREGIPKSTVGDFKKHYEETGSFANKPKSGRPRLFTARHERKVTQYITSGQCSTAVDI